MVGELTCSQAGNSYSPFHLAYAREGRNWLLDIRMTPEPSMRLEGDTPTLEEMRQVVAAGVFNEKLLSQAFFIAAMCATKREPT